MRLETGLGSGAAGTTDGVFVVAGPSTDGACPCTAPSAGRLGLVPMAIGADRAIQGNLDPVTCLAPFDVVAERSRVIVEQARGRPGHIFNLGHGVLPGTDPDTLRRVVALVHEATAA